MQPVILTQGGDRRLILQDGEASRRFAATAPWNKMRLGFRLAFDGPTMPGTPHFLFGLHSNPDESGILTNGPLAVTSSHFIGVRTLGTFYDMGGNQTELFHRVGASATSAGGTEMERNFSPDPDRRTITILEIVKGVPNWSFRTLYNHSGTSPDMSTSDLIGLMELPELEDADFAGLLGFHYDLSPFQEFPINEADGILNAVCFAWTSSTNRAWISDIYGIIPP